MSYPDPNGGRQTPPPTAPPPPPYAQTQADYYNPVQAPPQQPYYSAGPHAPQQAPAAAPQPPAYAYTVPAQQYGAPAPLPPGAVVTHNPVYYAQPAAGPPPPQYGAPSKIQPMETYAAPPPGGVPIHPATGGAQEEQGDKLKYQDLWAAILFVLHLGVIAYLAFVPGLKAMKSGELLQKPHGNPAAAAEAENEPKLSTGDMMTEYVGVGFVLVAAAVWCGVWLTVLLKNAGNMIKAAFFGSMASSALGIAGALLYGNYALAFVCFLGLAINGMYYYCVRNRIPFAAANLKCAASAVLKHKSLLFLAGVMAVVQIAWVMLWQLAALGVVFTKGEEVVVISSVTYKIAECASDKATNSCFCTVAGTGPDTPAGGTAHGLCEDIAVYQTSVAPVAVFLLLVSMFWASLVAKNVLFCTVAGTVADWWYSGDQGKNQVRRSFVRAITTSFGSICFGSLILAVLRATREMVKAGDRDGRNGRDNAARAIVQCLLACIDRLMQIFNRYTMVFCSVFGSSFIESGRKTFDLFKTSGLTAIINDDLAETALNLVSFVVALLTAVVGYIYGVIFLGHSSDWAIVLAVVGFFAGLFLALLAMSVIDAGVAAIYVLNAEDPEALMRTHPPLFVELNNAWAAIGYNYRAKTLTRI